MIQRRDLIIGASCLAALGLSEALRPRRRTSLLGTFKLDDVLPRAFGDWTSWDVSNLVTSPPTDLKSRWLYTQTVGRIYRHAPTGAEIMMLADYGDTQSNDLQLHRPEGCYPAAGFSVVSSQPIQLALSKTVSIPSRKLVADAPDRRESIIYWSRLGERLPMNSSQQRVDRLRTAMEGVVADGILMRFSGISPDPAPVFSIIETFVPALIQAVPPQHRPALIGSRLAAALGS